MRTIRLLAVVGAIAALAAAVPAVARPPEDLPGRQATYEITVTNLTEEGQWFTPPVVVAHRPAVDLFEVGEEANLAITEIAENGNLTPAVDFAESSRHVLDFAAFVSAGPPPLAPGASVSGKLTPQVSATRLSVASMLICTNDGFTGVDSVRLPTRVGETVTVYGDAYDAGTEINTEAYADIVPPCQGLPGQIDAGIPGTNMSDPDLAENGVITHHPGIAGTGDLVPGFHGWTNPVSKVEITRTG